MSDGDRLNVPVRRLVVVLAIVGAASCGSRDATGPADLDTGHASCSYCRMGVTDQRFASQLVAPGEEPKFFDDLGCASRYLAETQQPLAAGSRMYVADHRTRAWIPAERAVYTRVEKFAAPMGSHYIAHASAESRAADPDAAGGAPIDAATVFGGRLPTVAR